MRRWLYSLARWLGDWGAVKSGTPGPRLFRRGLGWGIGKWFLRLFN